MRTRDILRAARRDGKTAGINAASWVFDGNTTDETYLAFLKGIDDGDPAILDSVTTPNLSGEWAGDPTPGSLADAYGLTPNNDPDGERLMAACYAWEAAASDAFWAEIERVARRHVA